MGGLGVYLLVLFTTCSTSETAARADDSGTDTGDNYPSWLSSTRCTVGVPQKNATPTANNTQSSGATPGEPPVVYNKSMEAPKIKTTRALWPTALNYSPERFLDDE